MQGQYFECICLYSGTCWACNESICECLLFSIYTKVLSESRDSHFSSMHSGKFWSFFLFCQAATKRPKNNTLRDIFSLKLKLRVFKWSKNNIETNSKCFLSIGKAISLKFWHERTTSKLHCQLCELLMEKVAKSHREDLDDNEYWNFLSRLPKLALLCSNFNMKWL